MRVEARSCISFRLAVLLLKTNCPTGKLEASKQQVDKTLIELKQTQAQLVQKEKLASLGELTAGIAHEIQNPLNFVNNFADFSIGIAKDLNEELDKPKIDKGYIEEL